MPPDDDQPCPAGPLEQFSAGFPLLFLRPWWSDMRHHRLMVGPKELVIGPGLRQADITIRPSPYFVRPLIILSIIFPETDRADIIAPSFWQGFGMTTGTAIEFTTGAGSSMHCLPPLVASSEGCTRCAVCSGSLVIALLIGAQAAAVVNDNQLDTDDNGPTVSSAWRCCSWACWARKLGTLPISNITA